MRKLTRRAVLSGGIAIAAAGGIWWTRTRKSPLGMQLTADLLEQGAELVATNTIVDIHSHPGRFFLTDADPDSWVVKLMRDGFEDERIADMRDAGVTASLFSIVADLQVLGVKDGGLQVVREFRPGEAYADFNRQLARLQDDVASGIISLALSPADIQKAAQEGRPVAILASEGGDFMEGDVQRIGIAYAAGLRSITLLHYNTNALGDSQTAAPVHGGLTQLGHKAVAEMNRLGIIVDVAHASYDTCVDIVAASTAPVILSHSILTSESTQSPRLISRQHAKMIADSGGVVGAWPAGIGSASLGDFVKQVVALVDAVGVEHVAIGTDMDANYKPVLTDYADFPWLAAGLLQEGLHASDVANILGGNFLRVFGEVVRIPSESR